MPNFVTLNEGLNRGIDLGGQLMDFSVRRESNRIARGQLDLARQEYDDKRMLQRSQLFAQRYRTAMANHYSDPNAPDFNTADFLTNDQASAVEAANILRHKMGKPDDVAAVTYGNDGRVNFIGADGKTVVDSTTVDDFQNKVAGHAAAYGVVDAVRLYSKMTPEDPQYSDMTTKVSSAIQNYARYTGKPYSSQDAVVSDAVHTFLDAGDATTPAGKTYVPNTNDQQPAAPGTPAQQPAASPRAMVPTPTDTFYGSQPILGRLNGASFDMSAKSTWSMEVADKADPSKIGEVTITGVPRNLPSDMAEYLSQKLRDNPEITPGTTITFDDAVTKIGGDPRAFKKDPQLVARMIASTPDGVVPPTVPGMAGAVVGNVVRGVDGVLKKSAAGYGQMADDIKQGIGEFKAGMGTTNNSTPPAVEKGPGDRPVVKLDALKPGDTIPGFDGSGIKATFRAADGSIVEHPGAEPSTQYIKATIKQVGTPKGNYRAASRYLMMMSAATNGTITDSMMKGFNDIASTGRLNGVELDAHEIEKSRIDAQLEIANMGSFNDALNPDLGAQSRVYGANLKYLTDKPVADETSALKFLQAKAEARAADEIPGGGPKETDRRAARAKQLYGAMLNITGNPQMLAQGGFALAANQRPDWGKWSYYDLNRVAQSAFDGRTIEHNYIMPDETKPGNSLNFDPAPLFGVAAGNPDDPEAQRFNAFTSQLAPADQQAFMGIYSDQRYNAVLKQLLLDNPNIPADQLMPHIMDYLQRVK